MESSHTPPESLKPGLAPRKKRGRPSNRERAERNAALIAQGLLPEEVKKQLERKEQGSRRRLEVSAGQKLDWSKGTGLKESARQVIGLSLETIQKVLTNGKPINGIRPEVALDKAMSQSVMRVAGYDDKISAPAQVQLVQLLVPAPGRASGQTLTLEAQVLESVRVSETLNGHDQLNAGSNLNERSNPQGDDAARHDEAQVMTQRVMGAQPEPDDTESGGAR